MGDDEQLVNARQMARHLCVDGGVCVCVCVCVYGL